MSLQLDSPSPPKSLTSRVTPRQPPIQLRRSSPKSRRKSNNTSSPTPALNHSRMSSGGSETSASLLDRLSGPEPNRPPLLGRITTPEVDEFLSGIQLPKMQEDRVAAEDTMRMNHIEPAPKLQPGNIHGSTAGLPPLSASRSGHHLSADNRKHLPEDDMPVSPNSEAAVDTILNQSDSDAMDEDNSFHKENIPSQSSAIPISSHIIPPDECRRLMTPLVVQNARRRNVTLSSIYTNRAEEHVAPLITDQHCIDFIQKAKQVVEQLEVFRAKGAEALLSIAGTKRTRDEKDSEGHGQRSLRRTSRFGDMPSNGVVHRKDSEMTLVDIPSPAKTIPKAPRAMLVNPKVRALEELFLVSQKDQFSGKQDPEKYNAAQTQRISPLGLNVKLDKASRADQAQRAPPPPYALHADKGDRQRPNDIRIPLDPEFFNTNSLNRSFHDHPPTSSPERSTKPRDNPSTLPEQGYTASRCPVPGLWFARVGLGEPDIMKVTFEVDREISPMPSRHQSGTDIAPGDSGIAVHLLCLPKARAASVQQSFGSDASPQVIADTLWDIRTEWPSIPSLVVDIQTEEQNGSQSWLPSDTMGPLDLTSFIHKGTNTIRFIQLGDLSDYIFILHASHTRPSLSVMDTENESKQTEASPFDGFLKRIQAGLKDKSSVDEDSTHDFYPVVFIE